MTRLLAAAVLMTVLIAGTVHASEPATDATLRAAIQQALQQIADRHAQPLVDAATRAPLPGTSQGLYPPPTNLFLTIVAYEDGLNHLIVGIHTLTLDMFAIRLAPDGTLVSSLGRPFVHGNLAGFVQTGPNTFRVTWHVSTSVGLGGPFIPQDDFVLNVTI